MNWGQNIVGGGVYKYDRMLKWIRFYLWFRMLHRRIVACCISMYRSCFLNGVCTIIFNCWPGLARHVDAEFYGCLITVVRACYVWMTYVGLVAYQWSII